MKIYLVCYCGGIYTDYFTTHAAAMRCAENEIRTHYAKNPHFEEYLATLKQEDEVEDVVFIEEIEVHED